MAKQAKAAAWLGIIVPITVALAATFVIGSGVVAWGMSTALNAHDALRG